jgi:hypothetical protein
MHGNEARFVEINGKACGGSKVVKDSLETFGRTILGLIEDQGIVRVLEDGAGGSG